MQVIVFKRPIRIHAKTRQELGLWGELAGTAYRENTRYRFTDEHAAKLVRNFKGIAVVVEEEEMLESDEAGMSAVTVSSFTKEGEALERAGTQSTTAARAAAPAAGAAS